jgi:error-prone DNA polymerase
MISNADTVGVFQVESRAQMSMLPRLRPNCFYDLVIEVAIVRPGPIQGNMVHPYLRRRCGEELVTFPSEELRQVLSKTLGVPLFQEQAMRIAMVAAGFTADEADKLRRAMAAWRRTSALEAFHQKIVNGMLANGYEREFAEQCFNQIKGFGEYGFPESHAASFALLVYVSAWLKRYHPAAFAAALINSQPMGFYMPAQIVRDAKEHGVKVLPVDVNWSEWDCSLERHEGTEARRHEGKTGGAGDFKLQISNCKMGTGKTAAAGADGGREGSTALGSHPSNWGIGGPALRLGLRQIKGFREAYAGQIVEARAKLKQFDSVEQFHRTTHLPVAALRILAEADAFGSLGLSRRQALWEVLELKDGEEGLFEEGTKARRHEGTEGRQGGSSLPQRPEISPSSPPCLRASVPPCLPSPLLPPMPLGQEVMTDYATAGLSLKQHPVALVREELKRRRIICSKDLDHLPNGRWVNVAGLVLIRQRPGTASGIVFETLEDETGIVNLIVKPDIYERYRVAARHAGLLQADGYLQKQGQVVHVIAKRLFDLSELLQGHEFQSRDFH